MYCELKNDELWVWSSRLSSLDCMPQYKFSTLEELLWSMLRIKEGDYE